MRTPLLVYVPATFEEYIASLSKAARYECRKAFRYGDKLPYRLVSFSRQTVAEWMKLWEQQIVEGKHPRWRQWTPEKAEQLGVKVFFSGVALQMLELYDDYAYAWPVLYDKEKNPWAAKFMWFKLIEWCCGRVKYLDMGGGKGKTWRQRLIDRDKSYKWLYVPKYVKQHPEDAPEWRVFECSRCHRKELNANRCSRCSSG